MRKGYDNTAEYQTYKVYYGLARVLWRKGVYHTPENKSKLQEIRKAITKEVKEREEALKHISPYELLKEVGYYENL